jgi:hypothetical protein
MRHGAERLTMKIYADESKLSLTEGAALPAFRVRNSTMEDQKTCPLRMATRRNKDRYRYGPDPR